MLPVELIKKKKLAIIAYDIKNKAFVIYVAFINQNLDIYVFWKAQIALLKADKTLISVSPEYIDFADIFSKDPVTKLLKYIEINNHAINLIKGW